MHIPTQDELIGRIEDFCGRHEMAESRFGREAVNNPAFIGGLREGKSPTLETLNKLKKFMADTDEQALLRAPPPLEPREAEANELPFSRAPVNPTGASSPTCSPTPERPPLRAANGSSRSCSETDA